MSGKRRQELRHEMRTVLARLDNRWVHAASRGICARLRSFFASEEGRGIRHILTWASFHEGQVDLSSLISDEIGVRNIYVPTVREDRSMVFMKVDPQWAHSEDSGDAASFAQERERYDPHWAPETAVLVPGLAFDQEGSRLGRGLGHYALFLRPPLHRAVKVGVCWEFQVLPHIPAEGEHVLMDWICHERGLIKVGGD